MVRKGRVSELRKGRFSERGRIYHVTFTTFDRIPLFADFWLGRQVVGCMRGQESRATTLAYVIMPDHIHWLIRLESKSLSDTVKFLKGQSACFLNKIIGRRAPVWQPGFYDRAIRREEDLIAIARYIVLNPVRGGLVKSVGEYPLWDACWLACE